MAKHKWQRQPKAADTPRMLTVTDGTTCVGFILNRGVCGHEAFNRDGTSVGLFPDQRAAILAIPALQKEAAR